MKLVCFYKKNSIRSLLDALSSGFLVFQAEHETIFVFFRSRVENRPRPWCRLSAAATEAEGYSFPKGAWYEHNDHATMAFLSWTVGHVHF
jgi:hypothetical protein